MNNKKIAVLTTSMGAPRLMVSTYSDGILHIAKVQSLPSDMTALKAKLPKNLESLRNKGFSVIVDETFPVFSRYGRGLSIEGMGERGKPLVVEAIQLFRTLEKYKAITYPNGDAGRIRISESLYNETRTNDGTPVYKIDWKEVKPEAVALLLTVYVCNSFSLADAGALDELLNQFSPADNPPAPAERFSGLMESIDSSIAKQGEYL